MAGKRGRSEDEPVAAPPTKEQQSPPQKKQALSIVGSSSNKDSSSLSSSSGSRTATSSAAALAAESTLECVASRCRDNITGVLLVDPVFAEDGHTYERRAITEWFRRRHPPTSPLTHETMSGVGLKPNYAVRAIVEVLANSPGLSAVERAEWHTAKAKLQLQPTSGDSKQSKNSDDGWWKPDVRAARCSFERADELLRQHQLVNSLEDDNVTTTTTTETTTTTKLRDEVALCRDLCDRVLDITGLRERAATAAIDLSWADDAIDAMLLGKKRSRSRGVPLRQFQQLVKGTRVQVSADRTAVLAAFQAQDDVLGLPDDWETALAQEFFVEKGDPADSTYLIVSPEKFTPTDDNTNNGKWWPFTLVSLLGANV